MQPISYARHRFPPDIIGHTAWLYLRLTLSYRDVEDLLAELGLMVSNASIRRWVLKFGPIIAKNLRAIRPKPHSRWHLDEMVVSIAGRQMYMWRGRQRRRGSRNRGPAPTRQGRGVATAAEIVSASGLRSDGYRHRQTQILRSGASRNWLLWFARARTACQQSSGEFSSAACKVSNQSSRLSVLFPSMRPFTTHSMYNDI
jgi:hypothetical protein